MTVKTDAIKYLEHRISADKTFAKRALAELIYDKHCKSATLHEAVSKWKAKNATTTPTPVPVKPDRLPGKVVQAPGNGLAVEGKWDDFNEE